MLSRHDGTFTIYQIQHCCEAERTWHYSNLDRFGHPAGFNASGVCWQTTGVTGVFRLPEAKAGLRWIRGRHPDTRFRLVKVTISQQTEVIHEGKPATP